MISQFEILVKNERFRSVGCDIGHYADLIDLCSITAMCRTGQ